MSETNNKITALGLLSGGLDSTLAAKLLIDQGIAVHAINFWSPFCTCTSRGAGCPAVVTAVKQLGDIPLKRLAMGDDYLEMIRHPKHGFGRGMNPCIDCRIMKIKKAGQYMKEIGASFLFTGEVLGQRPMSQHRQAMEIIDRESGLEGLILRPLSAAHMKPTVPEEKGWVDRTRLLDIDGRSRKRQFALAEEKGINDYPCPAGGCLLTDKNFADKIRDYFAHVSTPSIKDMPLMKIGRHRRMPNGEKIVIARDQPESEQLAGMANENDYLLVPDFPGPTVLLQGKDILAAAKLLVEYTTRGTPDEIIINSAHKGITGKLLYRKTKTGLEEINEH